VSGQEKKFKELSMKTAKMTGFFAFGILAVLLSGCFNPITVIPPKTDDPVTDAFTIDVLIGKDGSARTVAGPDSGRIKEGIHNFMQLIVVDDGGNIAAFDEDRRENAGDLNGLLTIDSLVFGNTYHFLLLMGYWKHDGTYAYDETEPPTLLAAGLKEHLVTGSGKITVIMWPLVMDTVFTTPNMGVPEGSRTTAPTVIDGKPETVSLLPVDWRVTWTVKKGNSGNGFEALTGAQNLIPGNDAGSDLLAGSVQTVVKPGLGNPIPVVHTLTGNMIRVESIGQYTSGITKIGATGSVQFRLEYVPFNLTDGGVWSGYNGKSKFTLDGTNVPVWIIRNGINDDPQNAATDFNNFMKAGNTGANGNGAVAFVVTGDGPDDSLTITGGVFENPDKEAALWVYRVYHRGI
jgi:hypothetical protein